MESDLPPTPNTNTTVVVGGGPAGLAAAYRLAEDPRRRILVLERGPQLGGLAAGMSRGDMRLDFGPHRLHPATAPAILSDLRHLLGDDLLVRPRRGRIYLGGRYLPYPPSPTTILGLGAATAAECLLGLLSARVRRIRAAAAPTFESVVVGQLGRPLYDLFYGPFAEKVWGRPGRDLSAAQAARRVNQHGVRDLAVQLLRSRQSAFFYYPRLGFGQIPAAYERALRQHPNVELRTGVAIDQVHIAGGRISDVTLHGEEWSDRIAFDHLVWTAPLTILPGLTHPSPPDRLIEAARQLRHRGVIIAYLELDTPALGQADTYYFPQQAVPFNRVAEQRRFSAATVPGDGTVLVVDIACDAGDHWFTMSDGEMQAQLTAALGQVGLLRGALVRAFWTVRFPAAYPIYDLSFEEPLAELMTWTQGIDNLWLTGRQGLFLHNNTHHSLQMGYAAADAIRRSATRQEWADLVQEFGRWSVAD